MVLKVLLKFPPPTLVLVHRGLFPVLGVRSRLFPQREHRIHTITLIFTIDNVNSRANGSLIAPITFTDSLRSREQWPLRGRVIVFLQNTSTDPRSDYQYQCEIR